MYRDRVVLTSRDILDKEFKIVITNNSRVKLKDGVMEVPSNNSKQKVRRNLCTIRN